MIDRISSETKSWNAARNPMTEPPTRGGHSFLISLSMTKTINGGATANTYVMRPDAASSSARKRSRRRGRPAMPPAAMWSSAAEGRTCCWPTAQGEGQQDSHGVYHADGLRERRSEGAEGEERRIPHHVDATGRVEVVGHENRVSVGHGQGVQWMNHSRRS